MATLRRERLPNDRAFVAAIILEVSATALSFVGPVRRSMYLSLSSLTVFFNHGGRTKIS